MEFIAGFAIVFLYFIQLHLGEIAEELKKMNRVENVQVSDTTEGEQRTKS
jgi:predicted nucleic acid-binding protein